MRLYTYPRYHRAHSLRIDFPVACRVFADAEALGPHGQLPHRLILSNGELIGMELTLTEDNLAGLGQEHGLDGAIQIYFYRQPRPRSLVAVQPLPVTYWSRFDRLIARPGTAPEFRQYHQNSLPLIFRGPLSGLPDEASQAGALRYMRTGQKIRGQYATSLLMADDAALEFAVSNSAAGAWFLFVNGEPVFSWGRNRVEDKMFVSPVVQVPGGLNRVDFFVLLETGEELPVLLYRQHPGAFGPIATEDLFSTDTALTFCLEGRRDLLSPGIRLEPREAYHFADTDTLVGLVQVYDFSQHWLGREIIGRRLIVDGQAAQEMQLQNIVALSAAARNSFDMQVHGALGDRAQLTAEFALDWTRARRERLGLRPGALPLLEPVDGPLRVPYELNMSDRLRHLIFNYSSLRVDQQGRDGQILSRHKYRLAESPHKREVLIRWHSEPAPERASLTIELAGQAVSAPIHVYRVTPQSALEFRPGGNHLRYRDGFAIIQRPSGIPKPGSSPPTVNWRRPLVLVDDFIAVGKHPYADYNLGAWDWGKIYQGLTFVHLPVAPGPGELSAGAKYSALAAATEQEPAMIVWAVGFQDLIRGMDERDYRSELLFVIHACRERGIPLMLVTPPVTGHLEASHLRAYALAVKELAASFSLPVLDLYSASLRNDGIAEFWRVPGEHGMLTTATPNADGRRWFCRALRLALPRAGEGD